MALTDLECPNCGAKEMVPGEDERLICSFCGSSFGEVSRICPTCGHYHQEEARHCEECGQRLIRDCPACGADNWILAEHCVECGRNLDLIEQMARRWQQSTQQRLLERQASMVALKEREERASQGRMATLLEVERERQAALAQARAVQEQRDRQIMTAMVVAGVVFVLLVALILVISVLQRGG